MGAKLTIKQIHAAIASDRFVDPSQVPVEDSKKLVEGTALLQRHHGNTRSTPNPVREDIDAEHFVQPVAST
jgi:hypothetical protein